MTDCEKLGRFMRETWSDGELGHLLTLHVEAVTRIDQLETEIKYGSDAADAEMGDPDGA
jgi:hypothetical protein